MLWTSRTYQHTVLYRDSFNILLPIGYRYTKNHSYAVLVISTTAWQNKVSLLIFRLMSLENLTKNQLNKLSPRAHKRAPLTDLAPAVWDQPRDPQVIIRQGRHLAITRLATSRSLLDTGAQLCFHYYCNPPYVWFWKSRNRQKLNLYVFERKSGMLCLWEYSRKLSRWFWMVAGALGRLCAFFEGWMGNFCVICEVCWWVF